MHVRLAWDEIETVFAYKQDCFGFDKIYVALVDRNGQVRVNPSEDDAGYQILVDALPK